MEAGRPDTITADKLQVLRAHGIQRISINPQTMEDSVLRTMGRAHTAAQIEEAMELARVDFVRRSVYDITRSMTARLLRPFSAGPAEGGPDL